MKYILLFLSILLPLPCYAVDTVQIDRDNVTIPVVIRSAAFKDYSSFATKAQGSKADSALQPTGNGSQLTGITAAQVGATIINMAQAPYNAVDDGTTVNTTAINNAISALPAQGGTLYFPYLTSGVYKLGATITPNKPVVFMGGVPTKMVAGNPQNMQGVKILWGGGAAPMFSINGVAGVKFEHLILDGNNTATYAVYAKSWNFGGWTDFRAINATVATVYLGSASRYANDGTSWSTFTDGFLSCNTGRCLVLSGDPDPAIHGNVCHNLFQRLEMDFGGDYALFGELGDNNTFVDVRSYRRAGAGKSFYFGPNDGANTFFGHNYFFHLQADGGGDVYDNMGNMIVGYDRGNGAPDPTLYSGAKLMWGNAGPASNEWHFSGDVSFSPTALFKDGTVSKTLAGLAAGPVNNIACSAGNHVSSYDSTTGNFTCSADATSSEGATDTNAVHVNAGNEISSITTKSTPASGDYLMIEDSAAGNAKKKITVGSLPSGIGTVTSVASANTDISVANPTTTPSLTLNSGAAANQIVKRNADAGIDLNGADWMAGAGTVTAASSHVLTANTAGSFSVLRAGASIKLSNGTVVEALSITDTSNINLNSNVTASSLTWSYKNPLLVTQSNGNDVAYLKGSGALGLKGDGNAMPKVYLHAWGGNPQILGMRANGTPASPTAVALNDTLLAIAAGGLSSTWPITANLQFKATEAWGADAVGTAIAFSTTANGTKTTSEKIRIHGSGGVSIGSTTDPGAGNLSVTGTLDGKLNTTVTTATSNTVIESPEILSGMWLNNTATAGAAVSYTLPTAAAGKQRCYRNYTGKTGVITLQTSAAGQYIDVDGVNTASGGYVTSGGALADTACVVGVDATHWILQQTKGTWTAH